jgi:hypothetical protein
MIAVRNQSGSGSEFGRRIGFVVLLVGREPSGALLGVFCHVHGGV